MTPLHHAHWPAGLPTSLTLPATSVYTNLMVSALRYPNKAALIFYDTILTYHALHQEVLTLAGYLQQHCGVQRGDRVLLLITGKPPRPESERPHARGAIRAAVGDWLAASRHADAIAAVRGAHPRHGGHGALYIILRRPRSPARKF